MIFNKIQLLRNRQIKIERDEPGTFIHVQGPTIGELYDSEDLFLSVQIMLMTEKELKDFIGYTNELTEKDQIINLILTESQRKDELLKCFQKILPNVYLKDDYLFHEDKEITVDEWEKIKNF